MKIKRLRSIVNSLADMSASSRGFSSFDLILDYDVENLEIDLCTGSSTFAEIEIPLVFDLSSWFAEQLEKENISMDLIDSATLKINFNYRSVATNLDKVALFRLYASCLITTCGKQLEASSYGSAWHNRGSA
tara:strand:+ start:394 stop:789 length:396 start_codon:yes stop_codon:yes gene_type:complete